MKRLKPLLCGKSRTPKWLYCQEKSPDLAKFTQNRPVWSVAHVFLAGIASDIFTIAEMPVTCPGAANDPAAAVIIAW
jgi:hypothetical protein